MEHDGIAAGVAPVLRLDRLPAHLPAVVAAHHGDVMRKGSTSMQKSAMNSID